MSGPLYGIEVLAIRRKPGLATSVFDVSDDGMALYVGCASPVKTR
jgi:hypothetical protein